MSDPIYAAPKNRQLKARYQQLVEIVEASPGIDIDGVFQRFYAGNPHHYNAKRKALQNMLTSLCLERRLAYTTYEGYIIQEPKVE